MQVQFTIFYEFNKVLFKLLFKYLITTTIQIITTESSTLTITIYEEIIEKIDIIYNFNDDKLCKITLKFKIINYNSNTLLLQAFDIASEYPLNTILRISDI